tara:strand:- start:2397 stop:2606 length:210 start_codon:yes stop_codon:yes gene_type:complete
MTDIFIEKNHRTDIAVTIYEPEGPGGRRYLNIRECGFVRGKRFFTRKGFTLPLDKADELADAIRKVAGA